MKYMGDYVMIRGETQSDLVFFLLLVSINADTWYKVKSAFKNLDFSSRKFHV